MKPPTVRANQRCAASLPRAEKEVVGAKASDITASRFCPRITAARRPRLQARVMFMANTARRSAPIDVSSGRLIALEVRTANGYFAAAA